MNSKSISRYCAHAFLSLQLLFSMPIIHAGMAPNTGGNMPYGTPADFSQMTPEQLTEFEKQLEQEIQSFVKTLSPEQQTQFHKDVEELTKVMENMNEDELEVFFNKMVSEGQMPQPPTPKPQPKIQEPTSQPVTPKPEAPIKPKPVINDKEKEARALLESIIYHIRKLTLKIQSDPTLGANIEDWGKAKEIDGWQATTKWTTFKADLEKFEQQCNLLIDQDKKTQTYRYLPYLIDDANASVYNAIQRMNTLLTREISDIIVPEFGLSKLTDQSKRALKKSVSAFAEAFYIIKIPASIDDLIKKYEGTAQELKKAEEASRQKATDFSKKTTPMLPTRVGGSAPKSRQRPSMKTSSDSGRRGQFGYSSYQPSTAPSYQQTTPSIGGSNTAGTPGMSRSSQSSKAGSEKSESAPAASKSGGKEGSNGSKHGSVKSPADSESKKGAEQKLDRALDRHTKSVTSALDNVAEIIENKPANSFPRDSEASTQLIKKLHHAYDQLASFNFIYKDAKRDQQPIVLKKIKEAFADIENPLNKISLSLAQTQNTEGTAHAAISDLFRAIQKIGENIEPRIVPEEPTSVEEPAIQEPVIEKSDFVKPKTEQKKPSAPTQPAIPVIQTQEATTQTDLPNMPPISIDTNKPHSPNRPRLSIDANV